jgi:thiol:disulfide interchange protein DsbA
MEPVVADWVKKQGANINFKRIPFPFQGPNDPEAHLFLTLEAMGKAEEVGPKVFRAVHIERKRLSKDDQILDWVAKSSGLDNKKFMETWNSFGVLTKLKRLPQIAQSYKISGTPEFVIDGKYLTSPSVIGAANPALQSQMAEAVKTTLDTLVAKAAKEKGAAAPAKAAGK